MRIALAAPVRPGENSGNDVTAARWQRRLHELGHTVVAVPTVEGRPSDVDPLEADVMIALHARRCAEPAAAWAERFPNRPLIVGLAGTDLYRDLPDDPSARHSIDIATKLVVLQSRALDRLARIAPGTDAVVIHQSVEQPLPPVSSPDEPFTVAVVAHLRAVKDPLMAARAVRLLPADDDVVVEHAGVAFTGSWDDRARAEAASNPRYRWLGGLPRHDALALIARSHVLACTSTSEGGANVVSEAIAIGVPVVGTAIDGNIGLLGDDYPGLVAVGDDAALAEVFSTLEHHPTTLGRLRDHVAARRPLFTVDAERDSWAELLAAL